MPDVSDNVSPNVLTEVRARKILVIGLNPAWQQIFTVPGLRTGEVNRATGFVELASGKGMNVAKILAARGHEVTLVQVLAGEHGRRILDECARRGIRSVHVFTPGETRVCATLLHDAGATEVIAPFTLARDPFDELFAELSSLVPAERFDAVLMCGTVPQGMNQGAGGVLASGLGAPLLIWDSVAGVSAEVLARIDWLKVNAAEARALEPALAAARAAGARAPSLLITDGARPARLRVGEGDAKCALPPLDHVVNPIGAGDTVTAMFADGLLRGLAPRAAAAEALAAAAASCLNVLPAVWNPDDAARLVQRAVWSESEGENVRAAEVSS